MSSPITQWTDKAREAVMRARHGDNYAEIMPADNPDDKADLAVEALTSATIELIEKLLGPDDRDYSQDNADPESLAFLVAASTAANDLRHQVRQSLKELKGE